MRALYIPSLWFKGCSGRHVALRERDLLLDEGELPLPHRSRLRPTVEGSQQPRRVEDHRQSGSDDRC